MGQPVEPDRGASSVSFKVEQFEAQGRGRMVLSGRWFGLRGRRFVRPTLTLGADGHRQRALADLDHKPWAAEDGELWEASFPYERNGYDLGRIELTVAPDITIALPLPGSGAAEQRIAARRRRDDLLDNLRGARRDGRPAPGSSNGADPRRTTRRRSGEAPELAQRLAQAQQEIEKLKAELARREGARVEAASSRKRGDAAVGRPTEASPAREQASRARDHAVRARDQALRERDHLASERDQALRDRDRAIAKAKKLADAAATRGEHRAAAPPMVGRARAVTSHGAVWAHRILAVSVLVIALLAFAITARLV